MYIIYYVAQYDMYLACARVVTIHIHLVKHSRMSRLESLHAAALCACSTEIIINTEKVPKNKAMQLSVDLI